MFNININNMIEPNNVLSFVTGFIILTLTIYTLKIVKRVLKIYINKTKFNIKQKNLNSDVGEKSIWMH